MDNRTAEFRRNVTLFFSSLKYSIDRPVVNRHTNTDLDRDRFTKTMMLVEEGRIRFNIYMRYQDDPTLEEIRKAKDGLILFAKNMLSSKEVEQKLLGRRFRFAPLINRERDESKLFLRGISDSNNQIVTVEEAISSFLEYVSYYSVKIDDKIEEISIEKLGKIIPRQQVAPAQFRIVNNKIVVVKKSPVTEEEDRKNIHFALEHIHGSGEKLIENLQNSNCDRRLLDSVRELHLQLMRNDNIIKIGLSNMACSLMGAQFQPDLPDAIVGMISSYNSSISLYVAQFPEWSQFSEKASSIEFDDSDISDVNDAATAMIDYLQDHQHIADPEVPLKISAIQKFISYPKASAKRAVFAVIRTIENLISVIVRHSASFIGKTLEKSVESGSSIASTAMIAMLGAALLGATGIGAAAFNAGSPWVNQVSSAVKKYMENTID